MRAFGQSLDRRSLGQNIPEEVLVLETGCSILDTCLGLILKSSLHPFLEMVSCSKLSERLPIFFVQVRWGWPCRPCTNTILRVMAISSSFPRRVESENVHGVYCIHSSSDTRLALESILMGKSHLEDGGKYGLLDNCLLNRGFVQYS